MGNSVKVRRLLQSYGSWVLLFAWAWTSNAAGETNTHSFHVATKVVLGEADKPSRSETIFLGAKVYDNNSPEDENSTIAVFDLDQRIVHLLNRASQSRCSVSFQEIQEFQAWASTVAAKRRGLIGFMANPRFTHEFDPERRTIRLISPWMTYEAVSLHQQGVANVVDRFTEFADWSKQLATVLYQGPPAQARMELNRELKDKNFLVAQVTLRVGKGPDAQAATSYHTYHYELSDEQHQFIRDVEKDLKRFDQVSFSAFRQRIKNERIAAKK